jgi:hypothetical protein
VLVALPPLWPFERAEAPVPMVLAPDDFAHPNSDGRLFCLDTEGVTPERLATLVYDNLRVHARRLDHPVSQEAADYVRAHLANEPADERPLLAVEPRPDRAAAEAPRDPGPAVVEVRAGVLGVALPSTASPALVRFGRPANDAVDWARATYLQSAARSIRSGTPVWNDGPALAVASGVARAVLETEVRELARTLDALGDPAIATSYLEVSQPGTR